MTPALLSTLTIFFKANSKILSIFSIIIIFIMLLIVGYHLDWTGFNSYESGGKIIHSKTLWDWMDLLAIPFILVFATYLLNVRSKQIEFAQQKWIESYHITESQNNLLSDYINKMSELILKENLLRSSDCSDMRAIAKARSLAAVTILNGEYLHAFFQFLRDTNLNNTNSSFVSFSNSILGQKDFSNLNMSNLNFSGLQSSFLTFYYANLEYTIFNDALLGFCKFKVTHLEYSKFIKTHLFRSTFELCFFDNTDFTEADMDGVIMESSIFQEKKPIFIGTIFTNATFKDINFRNVEFIGVNFTGACFYHTNLTGAIIDNCIFEQITIDDKTKGLPEDVMKNAKKV